jgi:hypothetical protein
MTRDRMESGFDEALVAAARGLLTEALPADVLDLPSPRGTFGSPARWPAWARGGALAGLVAALVIALWVVRAPFAPAGGVPVLRDPNSIALELRGSGYLCTFELAPTRQAAVGATSPAGSAVPRVADLVCASPGNLHPATAALILTLDSRGALASVHGKAGILGPPIGNANATRDSLLGRLMGIAFQDEADAATARAFLAAHQPLTPGGSARTTVRGLPVIVSRDAGGGYELQVGAPQGP